MAKRVTVSRKFPVNYLFEQWIQEEYDTAKEKQLQSRFTYAKALKSIRKFPLQLTCGKDAKIVEGCGDKICATLDKRLEQFKLIFGEPTHETVFGDVVKPKRTKTNAKTNVHGDDEPSTSTNLTGSSSKSPMKEYIPKNDSGAYWLLIALLEHEEINQCSTLSKSELIDRAEETSGKSFKQSESHNFYTLWNSMSKLKQEQLVIADGNPVRFQLSIKGQQLAQMIRASRIDAVCDKLNSLHQAIQGDIQSPSSSLVEKYKTSSSDNQSSGQIPFKFIFINGDNNETTVKDQSQITIFDNDGCWAGCLIKLKQQQQLVKSGFKYKLSHDNHLNDYITAFVCESDLPDVAPGLSDDDLELKLFNLNDDVIDTTPLTYNCIDDISKQTMTDVQPIEDSSGGNSVKPIFTLKPNEYDIIFIIDTGEVSGSIRGREEMIREIKKQQIKHRVQRLSVGDFMWIAQSKLDLSKTIALDFVVERKRMDDLASSIKDKRFYEQKFRLKQSGLGKLFYLVEDYGSIKNHSIDQSALRTAMANTRIHDHFQLKRTTSPSDSVVYLDSLTKSLKSFLFGKTLHCVSREMFVNLSLDIQSNELFLQSFDQLQQSVSKQKSISSNQIFAKQLLTIGRLTPPIAKAILKKFSSARNFFEELKRAEFDMNSLESFISNIHVYSHCKTQKVVMDNVINMLDIHSRLQSELVCKTWRFISINLDNWYKYEAFDGNINIEIIFDYVRLRLGPNFIIEIIHFPAIDIRINTTRSFFVPEPEEMTSDVTLLINAWCKRLKPNNMSVYRLNSPDNSNVFLSKVNPSKQHLIYGELFSFNYLKQVSLCSCKIMHNSIVALEQLKHLVQLCLHDIYFDDLIFYDNSSTLFWSILSRLKSFGISDVPVSFMEHFVVPFSPVDRSHFPGQIFIGLSTYTFISERRLQLYSKFLDWNRQTDIHCFVYRSRNNEIYYKWNNLLSNLKSGSIRSLQLHCRVTEFRSNDLIEPSTTFIDLFISRSFIAKLVNVKLLIFGGANDVLIDGDLLKIIVNTPLLEVLVLGKSCSALFLDLTVLHKHLTNLKQFSADRSLITGPSLVSLAIGNSKLETIILTRCRKIEHFNGINKGSQALVRMCEHLNNLNYLVVDCCKVSLDIDGLDKIINYCNKLNYLMVQSHGICLNMNEFNENLSVKRFKIQQLTGLAVHYHYGYRIESKIYLCNYNHLDNHLYYDDRCTLCDCKVIFR